MRLPAAEIVLNVPLTLPGIPVKQMREWECVLLGQDTILTAKRRVYEGLVSYMDAGGYPTEANPDFKEADIKDIVAFTIYPILTIRGLPRWIPVLLVWRNSSRWITYLSPERNVFIVEAKKVSRGEAGEVDFLAPRDMWDRKGGDTISEKIDLMFDTMDEDEERCMADYSILIDSCNVALSNGAKDLVEVI
ncbi:hypothetical protein HOY80DRAFT_1098114 [Tuber brumale]|nr:hypothetical protein HOY80DRAFT_1098114 [Tuber brumale]